MVTKGKCEIFKSRGFVLDYIETEPATVKETLQHEHWRKSMVEEYNALIRNHAWDIVPKPRDKKIIGCK